MLNKVASILRQDTGVGYYRLGQPTMFLSRVTKEKCRITPFTGKNEPIRIGEGKNPNDISWSDKTLMEITQGADVIWSTVIYDLDEIAKMLNLRKWSGAKWVVDIDDDLYNVSSDNPAKRNVELLKANMELCLKIADGITVSVPRLKEVYGHLNDNIFINPNGQDIGFWKNINKPDKKGGKTRIGWRGASGHNGDVTLIEPAINALRKECDIEFVTLGVKPPFKSEHHDWVGCLEFPEKLASLDLDIAVVPLIDKPYNRSKSNIAVQEFSMLEIPVVASPVENQLNMPVSYASNNYEWFEELSKLIKDPALRKEQGLKQYGFVKENYDQEKLAVPLAKWMEGLPRKDI